LQPHLSYPDKLISNRRLSPVKIAVTVISGNESTGFAAKHDVSTLMRASRKSHQAGAEFCPGGRQHLFNQWDGPASWSSHGSKTPTTQIRCISNLRFVNIPAVEVTGAVPMLSLVAARHHIDRESDLALNRFHLTMLLFGNGPVLYLDLADSSSKFQIAVFGSAPARFTSGRASARLIEIRMVLVLHIYLSWLSF
jgi:hypothetical protein